jgi:penicillin-binding protein 2
VYDRNDRLMVYNNPIYDIKVTFNQIDPGMDTALFCRLLKIDRDEFMSRINKDWANHQFSKSVGFVFMQNVSPRIFTRFQEFLHEFPGFYFELRNVRGYPEPHAAHLLGYISEVDKQIVAMSEGMYSQGDYIGITGIEQQYESHLKGEKGVSYVFKDNLGRIVGAVNEGRLDSSAVTGKDLMLTIDLELQKYAEQLMQGKRGSIVCLEPETGEILAMVSAPAFDPSLLTIHKGRSEAFNMLVQDTTKPLFDRSLMAAYPPGSIFKPVLALIAMEEGVLKINRTIPCNGGYNYKYYHYGCHNHPTAYNVPMAIQHSCNAYFFQTFRDVVEIEGFQEPELGLTRLNSYLSQFGLGHTLGIDLPNEKPGNLPGIDFYDQLYGKGQWRSTYIMSLGIGQGELQLTTLQMANLAAVIANRGYYVTPHVLRGFKDGTTVPAGHTKHHRVSIASEHFDPVIEGMRRAVRAGTAVGAYIPGIEVCGKTGTSQNPHGDDHSVFYAFAPADKPTIAIAVYVENAGWGGTVAAPIASLMIEKYLTGDIMASRKWLEKRMLEMEIQTKS